MKTILRFIVIAVGVFLISSCEELLEVPDISGEQVQILAPTGGTVVNQNFVNFTWNEVLYADAYLVQVAVPDFKNASQIVLDTIIVQDSTFMGTKAFKLLKNGVYQWQVKAVNSGYETPFSVSAFIVEGAEGQVISSE